MGLDNGRCEGVRFPLFGVYCHNRKENPGSKRWDWTMGRCEGVRFPLFGV